MKKEDPRNQFIYQDSPESRNVWVCGDWFPVGTFSKNIPGFPMNRLLKIQLDTMIQNVTNDWDFTMIICGEGEVRIGKSTLAQQIATYWTWSLMHLQNITLPHSVKENIVFVGSELIKQGNKLGRKALYSALIFDEAGADLEGIKAMKQTTQAVKDYLRECGQYNMLNLLVLPEYFDMPKGVALSRSIAMINVYWCADTDGTFQRGYFKFYNRPDKKKLYLLGKKDLNYDIWQPTFLGQFPQFYTFNEVEYKASKREALKMRETTGVVERKRSEVLYALIKIVVEKLGLTLGTMVKQINERMIDVKISGKYISRFVQKMKESLRDNYNWGYDDLEEEEGEEDDD